MNIVKHEIAQSKQNFTTHAGLLVPATLIEKLRLSEMADVLMPAPGSNRGYRKSELVNTMVLMLHEGGRCLDDVRHLHNERDLMTLLGFKDIPTARTLGNFLRRVGGCDQSKAALDTMNRRLLKAGLHYRRRVTLDVDATVIETYNGDAKFCYLGHRAYAPITGFIAETGQAVAVQMREGNVAPAKDNLAFIQHCEASLPEGVSLRCVRIDAAGYQADIVNYCENHGIQFVIRAPMNQSVQADINSIPESRWEPMRLRDGEKSKTTEVAEVLHTMNDTECAFRLVVQRTRVKARDTRQQELDLVSFNADNEMVRCGSYMIRAIATNMSWTRSRIVHHYNQRGEHSENRIKELCSDFAGGRFPCKQFEANAAYLAVATLSYNLYALLRMMLPVGHEAHRAITIRHRLYAMAGRLVRHARSLTLKLAEHHCRQLEAALSAVRDCHLLL